MLPVQQSVTFGQLYGRDAKRLFDKAVRQRRQPGALPESQHQCPVMPGQHAAAIAGLRDLQLPALPGAVMHQPFQQRFVPRQGQPCHPGRRLAPPVDMHWQRQFLPAVKLPLPGGLPRHQPHRGLLALGLTGMGIAAPLHQRIDLALARKTAVPVHRDEQFPGALPVTDPRPGHHQPARGADARQLSVLNSQPGGILGGNIHRRLIPVLHQALDIAGAGHGMPLVAESTAVEQQGIEQIRRGGVRLWGDRHPPGVG